MFSLSSGWARKPDRMNREAGAMEAPHGPSVAIRRVLGGIRVHDEPSMRTWAARRKRPLARILETLILAGHGKEWPVLQP